MNKPKWQILRRFHSARVKKERKKKSTKYPVAFWKVQSPFLSSPFHFTFLLVSFAQQLLPIFALYLTYYLVYIVELINDKSMNREIYQKLPSLSRSSQIWGVVHLCLSCNFCSLCRPALFQPELVVATFLIISLFQVPVVCMCGL